MGSVRGPLVGRPLLLVFLPPCGSRTQRLAASCLLCPFWFILWRGAEGVYLPHPSYSPVGASAPRRQPASGSQLSVLPPAELQKSLSVLGPSSSLSPG